MIDPSGIVLPEGEKLVINEVRTGVFVVENAYEGVYEYFSGRPMKDDYTMGHSNAGQKGAASASAMESEPNTGDFCWVR